MAATGQPSLSWLHALRDLQKREQPLTTTEWGIAAALMSYANAHGVCSVSVPTLAATADTSDRSVQRALRKLQALGLLHVERSKGGHPNPKGGPRPTNTYVLVGLAQAVTDGSPAVTPGTPLEPPSGDRDNAQAVTPVTPKEKDEEKSDDERDRDGAGPALHGALPADLTALLAKVGYTLTDGERDKLVLLWERDRKAVQQATHDAKDKGNPSGWFHWWLTSYTPPAAKAPSPCPPCPECDVGAVSASGRCLHAASCSRLTEPALALDERSAPVNEGLRRLADSFAESFGNREPGGGA